VSRAERRRAARAQTPDTPAVPTSPVTVVVCHNGQTRASFAFCLTRLMVAETCRQGFPPGLIWNRFGSDQLVAARNDTVKFFLDGCQSEWALFVDADMGFPDITVQQLLDRADPEERPVVGALCFALRGNGVEDVDTQAVDLRMQPTLYTYHDLDDDAGFLSIADYERDALVQVAGTGMACVLVHRTVLERMREQFGDCWFDRIANPKRATWFGEDLSFCVRAAALDVPIFVDTSLRTSHDKEGVFLTEERYDEQQAAKRAAVA
jgi:hypothetical protein